MNVTLQTRAAKNFSSCRWGAKRRVSRAQTRERGPPSARAEISNEVKMRTFAEILASEQQRNILEINITRMNITDGNGGSTRAKALNFDDLAELIFDVLKIDHNLCAGYNYSTGRYETWDVKFKPGVDLSTYIKSTLVFKGHKVFTKRQMNNLTRVSFRNVPFNIPDEEIIQLCKCIMKNYLTQEIEE